MLQSNCWLGSKSFQGLTWGEYTSKLTPVVVDMVMVVVGWRYQLLAIWVSLQGFPGGSEVKPSAGNAGDPGSIPGSGRSPREGNGNTLAWRIPWTEEPGRVYSL